MITDAQKSIIRGTSARFTVPAEAVFVDFFEQLFERAPHLRPMFSDDIAQQANKIMEMFVIVVNGLDVLQELESELQELGARHLAYGVEPAHYTTARMVFLEALAARTEGWGPGDASAWDAVFSHMSDVMLAGAAAQSPPRAG